MNLGLICINTIFLVRYMLGSGTDEYHRAGVPEMRA